MFATKKKAPTGLISDAVPQPDPDVRTDSRVRSALERVDALEGLAAPLRRQLMELDERIASTRVYELRGNELESLKASIQHVEKYESEEAKERLLGRHRARLAASEAHVAIVAERTALASELAPIESDLAEAKTVADTTERTVNRERAYDFFRDHVEPKKAALIAALEANIRAMAAWFAVMTTASRTYKTAMYDLNLEKVRIELIEMRRQLVDPLKLQTGSGSITEGVVLVPERRPR